MQTIPKDAQDVIIKYIKADHPSENELLIHATVVADEFDCDAESCQEWALALFKASKAGNGHKPSFELSNNVNESYITKDAKGNTVLNIVKLINEFLAEYHFKTLRDTEVLWIYEAGVYKPGGDKVIKAECQKRVGVTPLLTTYKINEIIEHIKRSTYVNRVEFNQNIRIINFLNGLVDIESKQILPHTPDFLSTIQIPVIFDPEAKCPRIEKFLTEVLKPADINTILEFFGYSLIPDYTIQSTILLVGSGANGKSKLLKLLERMLGESNCSHVSWQTLEYQRFAVAALEGKLINSFADLPSKSLVSTQTFKMLTGGDSLTVERKFQDEHDMTNFARLIFSANKPPIVKDEDSFAFWRRWVIIQFPNQFTGKDADPNILDKLTTPDELSGLINLALDSLFRLLKQGKYSYDKSVDETCEFYKRTADPVYAFLEDCCESSSEDFISKDELYEAFKQYCADRKMAIIKPNAFGKKLTDQVEFSLYSTRITLEDKSRHTVWMGLKFLDDGQNEG